MSKRMDDLQKKIDVIIEDLECFSKVKKYIVIIGVISLLVCGILAIFFIIFGIVLFVVIGINLYIWLYIPNIEDNKRFGLVRLKEDLLKEKIKLGLVKRE